MEIELLNMDGITDERRVKPSAPQSKTGDKCDTPIMMGTMGVVNMHAI